MSKEYVLAMYDIRGKQDYIFKSTKLKEIVGASMIIRDIYDDYLMTSVNKKGECNLDSRTKLKDFESGIFKPGKEDSFSRDSFEQHLEEGYIGEIIYNGGGNFIALFKDEKIFNEVTHCFTYKVLQKTGSLRVIGTCVGDINFDDYEADRKRLYAKHRTTENTVQNLPADYSLPIGMVDPNSFMPIAERAFENKNYLELTVENRAKRRKYIECCQTGMKSEIDEKVLDAIAPEKGKDSHIAIIYADGNNMGAKVKRITEGKTTYEECIKVLRDFSDEIQEEYIDSKYDVIDQKLNELYGENDSVAKDDCEKKKPKRRLVLGAGDEINIIVAAKDAYEVAKVYLESLDRSKNCSSCAGIAIFRSHMPYADAYRIAEECCESGKDVMKANKLENACFLDFHYCQGAIDVSLEQIREDEDNLNISRPWLIVDHDGIASEKFADTDDIEFMKSFLDGIGHSNVKCLLEPAKHSAIRLDDELNRIKAHQSKEKRNAMKASWERLENLDKSKRRKLIYDMVIVYDLWFK